MSYTVINPAASGLGYDFTIHFPDPIGDWTVGIPIEKLAEDAGAMAIKAGAPYAVAELKKALPDLLPMAVQEFKKSLPDLLVQARPFLRGEVANALSKAKVEGTKIETSALTRAGQIGAIVILGVFGAAYLTRKRKAKS